MLDERTRNRLGQRARDAVDDLLCLGCREHTARNGLEPPARIKLGVSTGLGEILGRDLETAR